MYLFHPDDCLPATTLLFDTNKLGEHLGKWLPGLDLTISSIRYKPRTNCLVSYRINSEKQRPSYIHIKAFPSKDWPMRKKKLVRSDTDVLVDDEFAFAVYRFPSDAGVGGLQSLDSDPHAFVSRVMFQPFQSEIFSHYETLAYKPNRRYTAKVCFESGMQAVLKLHASSAFEQAIKSAEILKNSFSETPERIGRSNRFQALAYEWIDGTPVDFAGMAFDECKPLVQNIFDYLRRLHVVSGKAIKAVQADARLPESIEDMRHYLGEIYQPSNGVAAHIAERILDSLPSRNDSTIIHGDFHEQQILQSGSTVTACDLDNCRVGDSTMDLSNFVAHLHYRACVGELSQDLVDSIDELSLRHLSLSNSGERYRWNRIASLFKLASHPFRSGSQEWVAETESIFALINQQMLASKRPASDSFEPTNHDSLSGSEYLSTRIMNDSKLTFLKEAFDVSVGQKRLRKCFTAFAENFGDFRLTNVEGWRHKTGRRCMLQFDLLTDSGPKIVLGKASAKRLDRKAFNVQVALYERHGFDCQSKDEISVPKPVGFFKDWKMWFQEKVYGNTGDTILENGELISVTSRIAEAIVKLHRCELCVSREHTMQDELSILKVRLNDTSLRLPELANRIASVYKFCDQIGQSVMHTPPVLIHRDFYQDQILFSENRTTLLDLDLVSLGHPALDVGNFLAHLTEHSIRKFGNASQWSVEEQQIESRYLQLNPAVSSQDIQSFKTLSLARHISISASKPARANSTFAILAEVEAMIQQQIC